MQYSQRRSRSTQRCGLLVSDPCSRCIAFGGRHQSLRERSVSAALPVKRKSREAPQQSFRVIETRPRCARIACEQTGVRDDDRFVPRNNGKCTRAQGHSLFKQRRFVQEQIGPCKIVGREGAHGRIEIGSREQWLEQIPCLRGAAKFTERGGGRNGRRIDLRRLALALQPCALRALPPRSLRPRTRMRLVWNEPRRDMPNTPDPRL